MSKMLEKILFWVKIVLTVSLLCAGILMYLCPEDISILSIRLAGALLMFYAMETVINLKK